MTEPEGITFPELRLAARNHAMPQEALRWPITPIGLHYVLVHYDIPAVDEFTWRLTVDGLVSAPLSLSLEELRARPAVTQAVTIECAGNGRALTTPRAISQPWLTEAVGTAEWTGTPLSPLLDEAGLDQDTTELVFTGLDRGIEGGLPQEYQRALLLEEARRPEVILAYEMNGLPLPPQHGFPVRLVVPGWYGMAHVKWLRAIIATRGPFDGYQNVRAYRYRSVEDEPGTPVTRMAPRSLIQPPGIPEFSSRDRHARPGRHVLEGRAWSGRGRVVRVEVSTDGGRSWSDAKLGQPPSPFAWAPWSFEWYAEPGEHDLCSRATDETGETQPLEQAWNLGGYANNEVQRVRVVVESEP